MKTQFLSVSVWNLFKSNLLYTGFTMIFSVLVVSIIYTAVDFLIKLLNGVPEVILFCIIYTIAVTIFMSVKGNDISKNANFS